MLPANTASSLPENDPRRDLRITLTADKEEYFLGENVVLHYRIENRGKNTFYAGYSEREKGPFTIDMGGDCDNAAGRALRFKVEAIDQNGRKAEDPYPNPMSFGGPGGFPTLKPGDDFCQDLQLMRYREPSGTGTYTIKVYHDLGWEQMTPGQEYDIQRRSDIPTGPHHAPILTTTIRLAMPAPEQARQVVDATLKLPTDPNRSWGKRGRPFADFTLLRYPVYLPIMRDLVKGGDIRGLEAIGAMAFPVATESLLELTSHETPAIASRAEELLLARMLIAFPHEQPSRERYLADRSWRPDLKLQTVQLGWNLLANEDRESRIRGGRIIRVFGGKGDLPRLIQVMDKLLPAYKDNDIEQRAWLRPATVSETLSWAAATLIERGATPPTMASTPGEAAAFLAGLKSNKDFRPSGWHETVVTLTKHNIPFLRALALQAMPLPLGDASTELVAARIQDEYPPVQAAACALAGKSKSARFRQPLTDILRTAPNEWLLREAFRAATDCGAEMDRVLEILVDRLERHSNDRNLVLLDLMIDGAIARDNGSSGAEAHADWQDFLGDMQRAWRHFIEATRQSLRQGHRVKLGDARITPNMFPPGFHLDLHGQPWPPIANPTPGEPAASSNGKPSMPVEVSGRVVEDESGRRIESASHKLDVSPFSQDHASLLRAEDP